MAFPTVDRWFLLVPQCAQGLCIGVPIDGYGPISERPPQLMPIGEDQNFLRVWHVQQDPASAPGMSITLSLNVLVEGFVEVCFLGGCAEGASDTATFLAPGFDYLSYYHWNLIPNGDFFAIQNCYNTDQNLNVAGDGPYPAGIPILTWDWGGGAPNELWTFVPAIPIS